MAPIVVQAASELWFKKLGHSSTLMQVIQVTDAFLSFGFYVVSC